MNYIDSAFLLKLSVHLKDEAHFISAYNKTIDDLNVLQTKRRNSGSEAFANFDVKELIDITVNNGEIFISLNDNYQAYPDSDILQLQIVFILRKHIDFRFLLEFHRPLKEYQKSNKSK